MTLYVGSPAPDFNSVAIMGDNSVNSEFNLQNFRDGSYCLLFFYSIDNSLICPTELIALNNRIEEFNKRNTKIIALSTDSHLSHLAWKKIAPQFGGVGNLNFPLVSDMNRDISSTYDVLVNNSIALRASFIIDKEGVVRHQAVNDFAQGRNINELLRIIDALQFHENTGDLCPANWQLNLQAVKVEDENAKEFLTDYAATL